LARLDVGDQVRTPGERGRRAEDIAAAWLERQGFTVLARNHATRRGEVDLVCRENVTLCFVEVRSRRAGAVASPAESVGRAKMRRVVAAATDWALRHGGLEQPMRFDLVSVTMASDAPAVELIRGAFDATGEVPF
jgi:putative endonuclease